MNIYTIGPLSPSLTAIASDVPGKPIIPVVTLSAANMASLVATNVQITWQAPFNHFADIDAYQILLIKADGTYVEDLLRCNGAINPAL